MRFFLFIARWGLRLLYIPLLPLKPRNKVVMLSREADTPPLDFRLIEKELNRQSPETEVVYFCKKMTKSVSVFSYCLLILRSLYHIATASVAITDTYCIQLSVLPKKKGLTVIQIWHALGAVKKFSYQCLDTPYGHSAATAKAMCMHKNYDYILCASEATRAIYAQGFRVPPERILVKGMPRVDYIQRPQRGLREKLEAVRPDLAGRKVLLYLPTFRDGLEDGVDALVRAAAGEAEVALLVKPHPLSNLRLPEEMKTPTGWGTYDLMKVCDSVITDYSASSLEASLLDKEIYFYLFDHDSYLENQGLNVDPLYELSDACSVTAEGVLALAKGDHYPWEALRRFREKYIETAGDNNTRQVTAFLLEQIPAPLRQTPAGV